MRWTTVFFGCFPLSVALLCGCGQEQAAEQATGLTDWTITIETAVVERGRIAKVFESVGTLLPVRAATIVSEVDGVIQSLPDSHRMVQYEEDGQQMTVALGLDIGIHVNEGDLLVQLDPTDFELGFEQAQAQYTLIQERRRELKARRRPEEIRRLQASVAEAEAARKLAHADYRRRQQLQVGNAISQSEYDAALAKFEQAQAALEHAQADLDEARAGPTAEELAVIDAESRAAEVEIRRRQRDLEKTTILCPFPAVISKRYVGVGDRVTAMPRVEIMRIFDNRMVFAEVDVPERYQGRIEYDAPAEIQAAGQTEPLHGIVQFIGGDVDLATRTFRVRIGIDNRQTQLKPGGLVQVRLPIASRDDALLVPRHCITLADGQPAVYVYDPAGHVDYRPVQIGIQNESLCEILDGLTAGEQVALANPALLSDGLPVRTTTKPSAVEQLSQMDHSTEARP